MRPKITLLLFLLFTCSVSIFSQDIIVESNFKPAVSKDRGSDGAGTLTSIIQPDGKVLIAPDFQVVNGRVIYNVARLNNDGSTDTTFNCEVCDFTVTNIGLQPDGKILVGGKPRVGFTDILFRLNSDGSKDNSFNYPGLSNGTSVYAVQPVGVQPDGKIFIILRINGGTSWLYRLNADGSFDNSFTAFYASIPGVHSFDAKLFPDGRLFVFGETPYGKLAQVNSDGSKNNAFESPNVFGKVYDITLQPDGKIVLIGDFTSVNGIARRGIARINTDQTLDLDFNPVLNFDVISSTLNPQVVALPSGKIILGDPRLRRQDGKLIRLNNDGTIDSSFTIQTDIGEVYSVKIDSSERIYAFVYVGGGVKLVRLNTNGSFDASFAPAIEPLGKVTGLGLQADGKILVGGTYRKVNNFVSSAVARLNPDGTTDTTFSTNERFGSSTIAGFGFQPDGKILVTGAFFYNNVLKGIVRINADGSEDSSFNTAIAHSFNPRISDVEVEADGKILIGGSFVTVNGVARTGIARLNADGTLDASYNVQLGSSAVVSTILKQSDGKYMIAGYFTGVNGSNRTNLARLNADGTLDTSFNASFDNSSVGSILKVVITPDGKYLAISQTAIYKLNANGSAVSGFQTPTLGANGYINNVEVLNDNSMVISGNLVSVNGVVKNGLARLNIDGSLNSASFPVGTDFPPTVLIKQTDGKLLTGGEFRYIENARRTGLARLSLNAANGAKPFDFDGDGRTDIVAYRPSNSVWHQLLGTNYQYSSVAFGASDDILAPADFDGDGKTDLAIFRPTNGAWWYASSAQSGAFRAVSWGQSGDMPLPSDTDGDGKAEFVIYRPSNSVWYRLSSNGQATSFGFGVSGDKPVIGDFDGDGKSDYAVFRPSTGVWWFTYSSQNNAIRATQFGSAEDIPVPGDYDGDGKTDLAVFRPSNGGWYILNSGNGSVTSVPFGVSTDKPAAGDYDGDGRWDIAVYRPSNGSWYILRSTAGFAGIQFGASADIPVPNAFLR